MLQAQRYAEADLLTQHGPFHIIVYRFMPERNEEHVVLVRGEVQDASSVLCRVHSECFTGEVLGSLRCDCRAQLERAMEEIAHAGQGVLVYLRQEGRGIGLGNKIRAYALQAEGRDTVEANLDLGFAADARGYEQAAAMLKDLGVHSVALMTNNPCKLEALQQAGIQVAKHVPHWVGNHEHNQAYLEAKRVKLGHIK